MAFFRQTLSRQLPHAQPFYLSLRMKKKPVYKAKKLYLRRKEFFKRLELYKSLSPAPERKPLYDRYKEHYDYGMLLNAIFRFKYYFSLKENQKRLNKEVGEAFGRDMSRYGIEAKKVL